MDVELLLRQVEAELTSTSARAAVRALIQEQGGSRALEKFLVAFVAAGVKVTRHVVAAASRPGADRALKAYAAVLTGFWSGAGAGFPIAEGINGRVYATYATLWSFLMVSAASTPRAKSAAARALAALAAVKGYLGATASRRIEAAVKEALAAGRVKQGGPKTAGRPRLIGAWRDLAALPVPPEGGLPFTLGHPRKKGVPPVKKHGAAEGRGTGASTPAAPSKPSGARVTFRRGEPQPAQAQPPAPRDDEVHLYDVWFGTNRAPVAAADLSKGFANERDPNGTVHYGACSVEIPRTHKFGSMGTPFWKRWLRLEFTDDHLKVRKVAPIASEDDFLNQLRDELESLQETDRVLLVYLHGFNVSFTEAALRAAQIGFDLKVPGATAFYSWPSKGDVTQYPADIARVEASETQIADFLTAVATRSGARKMHVIAHSMGNRGFGRAVARITAQAAATGAVRFGQIILAAPDVDVDLFKQLAAVYPRISDRTTMYVSARDKALEMSRWLQDSDRAGFTPPVTVLQGIDTVEVTNIDVTLLGHGYYAEAEPVLYDMKELIDDGTPPERRVRIQARRQGAARYWAIGA